jgi:hypothetical protein
MKLSELDNYVYVLETMLNIECVIIKNMKLSELIALCQQTI